MAVRTRKEKKTKGTPALLSQATTEEVSSGKTTSLFTSISSNLPPSGASALQRIEQVMPRAWKAVSFESLPDWLRDNEYLHFHHRPPMNSLSVCVKSMFRLHTETWNIWTHFLGFLFFLILTLSVYCFRDHITHLFEENITISELPWQEQFVIFIFFLSAMMCLFCSATFHTLCNHSEKVHFFLSRLDYSGIAFLTTGSSIPCFYYVFYCWNTSRGIHIVIIMILCTACIIASLWTKFDRPKYRPLRAAVFIAFGLYGVVPVAQMYLFEGAIKDPLWNYALGLALMGALYIGGAGLYVCRIPERFFPGWFDIWAHSHQLFHICVVLAALVHYDTLLSMVRDRLHLGDNCGAGLDLLVVN